MKAGDYLEMCFMKKGKISSLFYSTGGLLMYLAAIDEISPHVVQTIMQVWEPMLSLILQSDDKIVQEDYEMEGLPCELAAFLIQELCRDCSIRDGVELKGLVDLCEHLNKITLTEKTLLTITEIWNISSKYTWLGTWNIQVHKGHLYYLDVNKHGTMELKDKNLDEEALEKNTSDKTIAAGVVGFSLNRDNEFIYIQYGVENQSGTYAIAADDLRIVNEPYLISQDSKTKLWMCLKDHKIMGCQDEEYYDVVDKEYHGHRTYAVKLCNLDADGIYHMTLYGKGVMKSRSVRLVRIDSMKPQLFGMTTVNHKMQQEEQENFLWNYLLEQTTKIKNEYMKYDSEDSVKERVEKCVENCQRHVLLQTPHPLSIANIRKRYDELAKLNPPVLFKGKCWVVAAMLKLLEDNGYKEDESVANALYTFWDCFNISVKARPTYRFPHRIGYFLLYSAVKRYKSKESTELKDLLEKNGDAHQVLMNKEIFWTKEKVLEQNGQYRKDRKMMGYFDVCNKQIKTEMYELREGELLYSYIFPPEKGRPKSYRGMVYYNRILDKPVVQYYTEDLELLHEVVEMFGWDETSDDDVLYDLGN